MSDFPFGVYIYTQQGFFSALEVPEFAKTHNMGTHGIYYWIKLGCPYIVFSRKFLIPVLLANDWAKKRMLGIYSPKNYALEADIEKPIDKGLLTLKQAAETMGIGLKQIVYLVEQKKIASEVFKINNRTLRFVSYRELFDYFDKNRKKP
jgi:hypothetical protein